MPAKPATDDIVGEYVRDGHWVSRLVLHSHGRYEYSASQSGFAGGQAEGHSGRWKLLDTGDVELQLRERYTSYHDMDDYEVDRVAAKGQMRVQLSRDASGRVGSCTIVDKHETLELTRSK